MISLDVFVLILYIWKYMSDNLDYIPSRLAKTRLLW